MDDEEDPIVEEIPVFLSKNLQDSLYLFQYPTKTELPNHDESVIINCCVKPFTQEVKVDFALNIDSKHYDRFKGEQFAMAADGKNTFGAGPTKGGERPTYKRGIMDKQAYTSTRSLTDISKYIVGIYTDKEVHLSPLTSIVQLRPALNHFDKEDKRKKAEQKAQNDDVDDDEVLQQVTVKFARDKGAAAKKTKEERGTYDSFVQRIVDEPWCETYWHARATPTAELERQKLYATNHQSNLSLTLNPRDYLQKLLPYDENVQQVDESSVLPVYNRAMLKTMPLLDQLRVLLRDVRMLSFGDVLEILAEQADSHVTPDKVLALLPQVGILLNGNWVPKSEVVFPEKMLSHANGVTAEQMIRARDYILYRFSRTACLYRTQVMAATQLPPAETYDVLHTVAKVNSTKRWELLLPPDKEFEQKHPELVQRQELHWRASEQYYNEMDWAKETKRVRKRSTRKSESQSATSMPPPTSTAAAAEA
ncbi:DNA-directed RNA polymerase III subunit RPC5 [Drosophila guanche]|uniref:Blast:DNA-directed RNA polymerase III subunit RPC5 n=1 Tax=Drosophila guanche TaxID=7266 RepID=A0A3B0J988_DROGU|nr:DNA-directed RNA polymerase III subunit RPC5 [Drosophila guanche]SPP76903.1 blast:DNA-directed RNA polymerase III subunit RPC5 [Drosophila guanche]